MSAQAIRLKKEARALFWPWCAVLLAGASPIVVSHRYAEPMSFLSFFVGVPLLATLSLGSEFLHRTFSLWLVQPVSRMQLWREKMQVMFPAVISAGLVSGVVMFSYTWPRMALNYRFVAVIYVVAVMAAAPFWTLATRSTLGALALMACSFFVASLFSGGVADPQQPGHPPGLVLNGASTSMIAGLGFCFSVLMLWLGARRLERFQLTGGIAADDIMTAGPALAPEFLAAWFRCRPSGAFTNLVRKEFRLLRPLWLITLVVVTYLASLAIFGLLPSPPVAEPRTVAEWAIIGPLVSLCIGMAGLAGILSLGEERTSGAHAWHMTLPISVRQQWLLKLIAAMFAGLGCSLFLPVLTMMAVGWARGAPFMYLNVRALPDDVVVFGVLTFTCFWSACAANSTVRAVIWAFPVTAATFIASAGGKWLGSELARNSGTLRDTLVSSLHLSPFTMAGVGEYAREHVLWLFVPALGAGLAQSYWLFRNQPDDSSLRMLRCIAPLVVITAMWSFAASASLVASHWEPLDETRHALDQHRSHPAGPSLSGEELAQNEAVSSLTRRWLAGAKISMVPDRSHPSGYAATIDLASGTECKLNVAYYGGMAASCRR